MTALNTPIVFNNSTGSDSQMSGSPSTRIIPSTLTLQITSGSNVAYGGSSGPINVGDLVYAPNQTSGRKFNVVASINTSVSPTEYTFDDNWDASDFSATCYSGGKRATFDDADSRKVFQDIGYRNAAKIQTETDQTLTSAIAATSQNIGVSGFIESADDTIKTITQTANAYHFSGGGGPLFLKKIKLDNSSSSKPASILRWDNGVGGLDVILEQCVLGDPTNTCVTVASGGGSYTSKYRLNNCLIQNMTGTYAFDSPTAEQLLTNNLFINNTVCVGRGGSGGGANATVYGNIFANSTAGVSQGRIRYVLMRNNIFYNCTTGVYWNIEGPTVLDNNLFADCTTAIDNNHNIANYEGTYLPVYSNFFYNNATKYTNNTGQWAGRFGDVDLASDPFVDAANGDFNLNNNLGGGSVLRSTKYTLGG